jgi:hypothetical protein
MSGGCEVSKNVEREESGKGCLCPFFMLHRHCKLATPYTLAAKPRKKRGRQRSKAEMAAAVASARASRDTSADCWVLG